MKRVVSLTPLAVERDSRTLKQAASIARLGYESVVVEGQRSRLRDDDLPFRLVTAPVYTAESAIGAAAHLLAHMKSLGAFGWITGYLLHNVLRSARALPDADLYYLHSYIQFPAVYTACRRLGVPFIYDAHDFYPPYGDAGLPRTVSDRLRARFLLSLERVCVGRAAEVFTTSEGLADMMEGTFSRRPEVMLNTHDTRMDVQPGADIRAALALGTDDFLVVVPGNDKRGAAIEETIEAMTGLPRTVHLAFVGAGYGAYVERIRALGLEERVSVLDPVPPSQFGPFIASADAALIPYVPASAAYRHAIGNRFFVPVAAGVPVLYPGGLPDLATLARSHDVGIEIDPRTPGDLVAAISRLLEEPGLLQRYRENTVRAAETLSWEPEERHLGDAIAMAMAGDDLP